MSLRMDVWSLSCAWTLLGVGCGDNAPRNRPNASGTQGAAGSSVIVLDHKPKAPAGLPPERKCEICDDFPSSPVFVDGAPASAPSLFGDAERMTQGLCIAEPADGSLFPWNWLRPRIRWTGSSAVYEVRIRTARQQRELVAYTTRKEYYLPREVWAGDKDGKSQGLARNNYEEDILVTVRGANEAGGTPVGQTVKFRTSAIDAGGTLVYWASVKTQVSDSVADGDAAGWLVGFSVGDEAVVETLRVRDVKTPIRSYAAQQKPAACIGCHTSTPDGEAVSFTAFWPWSGAIAGITPQNRGQLPSTITPSGLAGLQQMWLGGWTYSPGQWKEDYKIAVASYGPSSLGWPDGDQNKTNRDNLVWINIAAPEPAAVPTQDWEVRQSWAPSALGKAFGLLKRTGDDRAALMPEFSNGGSTVAYTSSSTSQDGRIGAINDTDIFTVPFNSGAGGDAKPLPGASAVGVAEYYPSYSADDGLVAFNRIDNVMSLVKPSGQGFDNHLYYRPESEIWIAPTSTGVVAAAGEVSSQGAIRLKSNDPNVCEGKKSPGVLNSWPKFSPRVNDVNGKKYYWLIFSSTRDTPDSQRVTVVDQQYRPVENRYSRLFMAPITVENGQVATYPAIYLWNQDETSNNLTPAWDEFKIPEVPEPVIPR